MDRKNNKTMIILIPSVAALSVAIALIVTWGIQKSKAEQSYTASATYGESVHSEEMSIYKNIDEKNEKHNAQEQEGEKAASSEENSKFTGIIVGQISNKETGEPVLEAEVILIDDNGKKYPDNGNLKTGSDGVFSTKLPGGVYSLEVTKKGYVDNTAKSNYEVVNGKTLVLERIEILPEKTAKHPKKKKTNDNDEYILPFSNERKLTDADLDPLSEWELKLARNEIYARHGRRFKDSELQAYFDSKSWYKGRYDPQDFDNNHSSDLNDLEKKNAEYILRYEKDHNYNT